MSYVIPEMRRSLVSKVLSVVAEYEGMIVFRLGPPDGSWMESTRIIISRAPLNKQIIITGDLCPCIHGILSNFGYGVGWFASRKSESYLCEKFLRTEFVPAKAREVLLDIAKDADERELTAKQRDLLDEAIENSVEAAEWDELNPCRSYEAFHDLWVELFDEPPEDEGFDYNPRDAGWLCAIQQRFAELYSGITGGQQ